MGTLAQVRDAIDAALAEVAWPTASEGVLRDAGCEMRFSLGDVEPVTAIGVVISGDAPRSLRGLVVHACRVNGWAARDDASGQYLDLDADLDASLN